MSTPHDVPRDQLIAKLESRIAELEERNQELAAPQDDRAAVPPSTGRWRGVVATMLIVLGVVLAPLAMVSGWARATVTDTDAFVATYAPLIRDPGVQTYVRDQVVAAIEAKLDVEQVVNDLVGGLQDVVGQRPRVSAALGLLTQPAVDGVRSALTRATDRVVTSEAFATTWEQALRVSHTQLIGALNGDPAVATTITAEGLGLQLGPIVDRVRTALTDEGFRLAALIPRIDRTVVIVRSDDLAQLQTWYQLATAVGPWLPWASLALLAGGVLLARRRRPALVRAAFGLAAASGLILGGLAITRGLLPSLIPATAMPTPVAETFFEATTDNLSDAAAVLFVLGLVIAVLGWWGGASPAATRLRSGWERAAEAVRARRDAYGLGTGRFGEWLVRHWAWVVAAVVVAAAGYLAANRPLTPGAIVGTALVGLLVLAVLHLLRASGSSRPDGSATAASDAVDPDGGEAIPPD